MASLAFWVLVCSGAPLLSVPLLLCVTQRRSSGLCPACKGGTRALWGRVQGLLYQDPAKELGICPRWRAGAQQSGPPPAGKLCPARQVWTPNPTVAEEGLCGSPKWTFSSVLEMQRAVSLPWPLFPQNYTFF